MILINTLCSSKNSTGRIVFFLLSDCLEFFELGHTITGAYQTCTDDYNCYSSQCDMKLMGGGWTLIQTRTRQDYFNRYATKLD